MGKRFVRLKEWDTNLEREIVPADAFLSEIDGTVPKQAFKIKTNSDGFITDPEKPESFRHRILVMGDSVVECTFMREGFRMTDIVEKNLRNKGIDVRVENGGRSGATSLSHLLSLLAKVIPLRPDLIVIMNGVIDADALIHESEFWTKSEYINPLQEETGVVVASKRRENLEFSSRSKLSRLIVDTCHLFGIKLVFATFPLRGEDEFRSEYLKKHVKRNDRLGGVNEHTRRFSRENGVVLLDLERAFTGRTDLFYDLFHLNENGARVLGEHIADFIYREYPQICV